MRYSVGMGVVGRPPRFSSEAVAKAVRRSQGNVTAAARSLNTKRDLILRYAAR